MTRYPRVRAYRNGNPSEPRWLELRKTVGTQLAKDDSAYNILYFKRHDLKLLLASYDLTSSETRIALFFTDDGNQRYLCNVVAGQAMVQGCFHIGCFYFSAASKKRLIQWAKGVK